MKKLIILIFLIYSSNVWAVDVTQSGAGAPISAAEFNALSGDKSGITYNFSGDFSTRITVNIYGTNGSPVILDGWSGGDCTPVTDLTTCDTESALLQSGMNIGNSTSGPDYINVYDFRMTRQSGSDPCFQIYTYQAGSDDQKNADYLNIKRNYVYETNGTMFAYWGGRYSVLQNNRITHYGQNGTNATQGVNLIDVDDFIVKENVIGHSESSYPSGCNSAELIELHYCERVLFELNDLYGAANQSGIRPKEVGHIEDIIVRYNNIHDNGESGVHPHTDASSSIDNIYIYANNIYNNGQQGVIVGSNVSNVHVWSNVIYDHPWHGVVTWTISPRPAVSGLYVYNNTITRAGTLTGYDQTGIAIKGGTSVNIKNNLLWNNRPAGASSRYHQIYSAVSFTTLEHDTLYHSSSTANFYYAGALRTLAVMQDTYNFEDASPAGEISDPGFVNPDGDDTDYGTDDDNYRLISAGPLGEDLSGNIGTVTIQGVTYCSSGCNDNTLTYDTALDPDNTDWTTTPPTVATVKRSTHGWERGAYAYPVEVAPTGIEGITISRNELWNFGMAQ